MVGQKINPRLPPRYHHRLEVSVVRRQSSTPITRRRRNPPSPGHRPGAGGIAADGDRTDS